MEIINRKYEEISKYKNKNSLFNKIWEMEGNAVGQIGELFIRSLFQYNNLPMDHDKDKTIHDEYDILSRGKKIEIKTAREGLKTKTFQFNGINPDYNHDYIILIGISSDEFYYHILDGHAVKYDHKSRKKFIMFNDQPRQLVPMNPNNHVNFKLTLTAKDLKKSEELEKQLIQLFQ